VRRAAAGLALALAAAALAARADGQPEPEAVSPASKLVVDAVDPSSRLSGADSASEYWDLVALLDGGVRVLARFTITNEGPGERSAAAFGHVLRPGAEPAAFQNGRREGAWRLSPDGRRIEIGSSLLALSDGARHFEVDNTKRKVKVFLDWREDASARSAPAAALPAGYHVDLLQLATPVRARVQVAEMTAPRELDGALLLSHTWMGAAEGDYVRRRIDVASADAGVYFVDVFGPAGKRFSWLSQHPREGAPAAWTGLEVETENPPEPGAYPIPRRQTLRAAGVHGALRYGPAALEVDPLSALPTFLRMVYSLRGRPHRSWSQAEIELSLVPGPELPAVRVAGNAIAALTFLDALPPEP
jgi:hypothetical protein